MMNKILMMACLSLSLQAFGLRCSKPVTLSDDQIDTVSKPVIAANEKGDAVVIWSVSQDEEEAIQVSFKTMDNLWSAPQTLSPWEERVFSKNAVMDAEGKISLCWGMYKDGKNYTCYGQKNSDEFWISPINVYHTSYYSIARKVQLLPNGEIIFIGEQDELGDMMETGKEVPYQLINTSTFLPYYHPFIRTFINSRGDGLVVWREWEKTSDVLKCCWYGDEKRSSPQVIYPAPYLGGGYGLRLVVSDHEKDHLAAVCWAIPEKMDGEQAEGVQVVTYADGQWSSIEDIRIEDAEVEDHRIAMNRQGDVLLVCHLKRGKEHLLRAAYKPKGQNWVCSMPSLPAEGKMELRSVTSDSDGNFVVLWESYQEVLKHLNLEGRLSIYGTVFSAKNQTLSDPVLLSSPALSCWKPSLALAEQGHGWLSWKASNGFEMAIQVAELTYEAP